MHRAFLHFDTDNSGTISKEELKEALKVSTSLVPCWFHNQFSVACLARLASPVLQQCSVPASFRRSGGWRTLDFG